MSEPDGTPETSMEAILASIRRIIAEDNIQPPPGVPPAPPKPRQGPIEPSPVLLNPAPSPQIQPVAVEPAASQPVAPLAAPAAAAPSVSPASAAAPSVSASPAPSAVWGVLGDQHGAGKELVLTQMVAEDGSVVSFEKSRARGAPAQAATPAPPKSEPLDVLLLTDALPGSLPDVAMPVTPPLNPAPNPAQAVPTQPAPLAAPVAAPRTPAAAEQDRARVGLASPEALVTSAAVLEQVTRARNQPAGQASAPSAAPTLEDLVRQSLEPRIQEWLNAHLQEIVERLVQKEIDRISSRI